MLVTDWNPLTVWIYKENYVRLSPKDYDPKKNDKYIHLTNNAIVRKCDEFGVSEIDGNMMDTQELQAYMSE